MYRSCHLVTASNIIGCSFKWIDLLAYTSGMTVILFFEKKLGKINVKKCDKSRFTEIRRI